jgi:methyl-accepting chemotaxis protein
MADLDRIADLLEILIPEVQELKSQFNEFTGHNMMDMATAVQELGDRIAGGSYGMGGTGLQDINSSIKELGDQITGGTSGYGGTSLEDVKSAIERVESTIDAK